MTHGSDHRPHAVTRRDLRRNFWSRWFGDSKRSALVVVLSLALVTANRHAALSETLTAVCEKVNGVAISHNNGQPKQFDNGIPPVSYTWVIGELTATLINSPQPGMTGTTTILYQIGANPEMGTFIEMWPQEVWMHTLYIKDQALILTGNRYAPRFGNEMIRRDPQGLALYATHNHL